MKLERITYNPDPLSHHSEYIQQFITQGIKIYGVHYFIEEYLIEDNKLFAIISVDKRTFYKYPISTSSSENTEDINKLIEELKKSNDIDKQSLSINGKELSISNVNIIELPEETDPVFKEVMTNTFEGYTDGTDFKEWSGSKLLGLLNDIAVISVDVNNIKDYREYSDQRNAELTKSVTYNKSDVDDKVQKLDERLQVVESKDDTELKTSISELKNDVTNIKEHPGVKNITIKGREDLAELSTNEDGGTTITLKGDYYKVSELDSNVPYLIPTHERSTVEGETTTKAIINQDLTLFPINHGELVTVTKETDSLTIHDDKVKEFVNTTLSTKETELKEYIDSHTTVTPSYVEEEIRKAKEELTDKINKQSGSSLRVEPSNNGIELYQQYASYIDECAKFTLKEVSTGFSSILNISYGNTSEIFYIPNSSIATYSKNGITVQFGNSATDVDFDITLPSKERNVSFELISFGTPHDVTPTMDAKQMTIEADTSYTP